MKQTTGVYAVLTAALFLGSMAGVGCGGDDDTTSGSTGGSGGTAGTGGSGGGKGGSGGATGGAAGIGGTGGSGGTAGTDGGAGKGGSAGSAGGDASTSIMCGTQTCGPVSALGQMFPPCCPMGEMNTCGATVAQAMGACITRTTGTPDTSCPSVMATIPLAGCCRPNGFCGLNFSLAMLGCADPTPLGGMGNIPCGPDASRPPDGAPPADTGGGDTGGGDTGGGDTGGGDTGTGDTGTGDTGTGDTGRGDTGDSAPPSDAPAG